MFGHWRQILLYRFRTRDMFNSNLDQSRIWENPSRNHAMGLDDLVG